MQLRESIDNEATTQRNPDTGIPEVCEPKKTGFAKWWPLAVAFVVGGAAHKVSQKIGKKGK